LQSSLRSSSRNRFQRYNTMEMISTRKYHVLSLMRKKKRIFVTKVTNPPKRIKRFLMNLLRDEILKR
jgi:hypothetical protein